MDTKFRSNYSDDEQIECMKQYLNGCNKEQLAKVKGVSKRTIERWIKNWTGVDSIDVRIAKRSKLIPVDTQQEIMQILNSNAISYGFNISTWNEVRVIKLLKDKYNIKITRYMARALLSDRKHFSGEYEEKAMNELNELEKQGHKLVLLDYIRIGRVDKRTIEPLAYKKFKEHRLNVNLGIARGTETAYIDIIFSDMDIIEKTKSLHPIEVGTNIKNDDQQRKIIVNDKVDFMNKVVKKESNGNKVVFVSTGDTDIERLKNKNEKALFYIVEKSLYVQLVQDQYEKDECKGNERHSLVQYMYNTNNEHRYFTSFEEIRSVVENKVIKYKSELEFEINNKENLVKNSEIRSKICIL